MKFEHIWQYVDETPWAILPSKAKLILAVLHARTEGIKATPEALQAVMGRSGEMTARGAVAVLPLRGIIAHRAGSLEASSGGTSTESFGRVYKQLMGDPNVSAVVLDVDSPGGAVAGVHELATEMLALRGTKPVIAIANSVMASAAFWLAAAAADEIWAIPSATVGSIGVAALREHAGEEAANVEVFTSAENKADSLGVGPLSEDGKKRLQARIDEAGDWFRADVAKGRGVAVSAVRAKFGEGAIFGGTDGVAAGLIDRVGTLDEAIVKASKMKSVSMRAEAAEDVNAMREQVHEEIAAAVGIPVSLLDADRLRRLERF